MRKYEDFMEFHKNGVYGILQIKEIPLRFQKGILGIIYN